MLRTLRHRLTYQLERLLLGGPIYRLLVIAGCIGLISFLAGLAIYEWDLINHGDANLFDAVWWAFLRLTDPGYLGDDQGTVRRSISMVVTVAGYVLFMGALIAIMTQWLNATITRLERGLTPIVRRRHVVVLGWTERTPEIVRELLGSGTRLRRFLHRIGARRLVVVVLAQEVRHELLVNLRERLGPSFGRGRIILRSGDPLRIEHLRRVDYARAGVIIIPGEEHTAAGEAEADARTVKILLTISRSARSDGARRMPAVVAAMRDPRKVVAARSAYRDGEVGILASDAVLSRLLAQGLRHPGLSYVVDELLTQTFGNEIYLREFGQFVGRPVRDLAKTFADAVVLGVLRGLGEDATPLLNPGPELRVEPGDRLVLLADDYQVAQRQEPPAVAPAAVRMAPPAVTPRRLLLLGWNHLVPHLLHELDQHAEASEVTLLSAVPPAARERRLELAGVVLRHLRLSHVEGESTLPLQLQAVHPESFDDVLILGSERLGSAEDSDARTLLIHHLVRETTRQAGGRTRVLVELHDPGNAELFDYDDTEALASGEVISHLLAQMALRLDLGVVYDRLFGPGGPEIAFIGAEVFGVVDQDVDFDRLLDLAAARGETVLGLRFQARSEHGGVVLNPPRSQVHRLGAQDAVVVMRTLAESLES